MTKHPMIKSVNFTPKRLTVDEMREFARGEADHSWSQKIDGKWLKVTWNPGEDTYRITIDDVLVAPSDARALIEAA